MRTYYIHNGNVQEGPFLLEELKQKTLNRQTPIWHEELPAWTTVEMLPEFDCFFKKVPPPFESVYKTTFEHQYTKKSLLVPLTIIGVVVCLGLLGLFVYNNTTSVKELNAIKQTQADITEKQNREEEAKLAEQARQKALNEALTRKNMDYRNNWSSYISFGRIYADIDKFWGGVKAFDIPIVNSTDYLLDEVQVEVRYIKDNGDIYKAEAITINNIPANSTKIGRAPSSPRGTSIDYQIMGIVSKKMHFCFPVNNGNPEDPFFCK